MAVRTVLYSEDRAAGGFEVPGSCLFDKDINHFRNIWINFWH